MNKKDLYEAIGGLDEETLDVKRPRKKLYGWTAGIAAGLALCVGLGLFLKPQKTNDHFAALSTDNSASQLTLLANPVYPEMAPYPKTDRGMAASDQEYEAWRNSIMQQQREQGYADSLSPFFADSIHTFLENTENKNRICSPVNIYMALSMLAEVSGGDARQEILDVLGADSIEALRAQANAVWNAQYRSDNATFMVLANSLWLNQDLPIRQDTLNLLAENYYAASYAGKPGSPEMDQALRDWINQQTGGLLESQAQELTLDPRTVMALASTIHYQAKWNQTFQAENTSPQEFFSPEGTVTADFLHMDQVSYYYWASRFGAIALPMENDGGTMWLVLPDEGTTPEQLLKDQDLYDFLENRWDWEQSKPMRIHLGLPKFDVSSDLELQDGLKRLGIQKVFESGANFSPLIDPEQPLSLPMELSQCSHAVRVSVDEEGVTAAAFTVMAMEGAGAPPDEEMDFILNRPFLFVIQSNDGLPLFAGIVNTPSN